MVLARCRRDILGTYGRWSRVLARPGYAYHFGGQITKHIISLHLAASMQASCQPRFAEVVYLENGLTAQAVAFSLFWRQSVLQEAEMGRSGV